MLCSDVDLMCFEYLHKDVMRCLDLELGRSECESFKLCQLMNTSIDQVIEMFHVSVLRREI